MPHTMPASAIETTLVHPVIPAATTSGDKIAYSTGDILPATTEGHTPTAAEISHANVAHALDPERSSRSSSRGRNPEAAEYVRSRSRDAFFRPGTPEGQAAEQKANILREVHLSQQAHEAGEVDRAVRADSRSRSRTREFIRSVSRSLSRDPFFHRGSPELQSEEQKANALSQTRHALEAHVAGVADEEKRHSRSGTPSGSRDHSHSRLASEIIGTGPEPRGAAGFGST